MAGSRDRAIHLELMCAMGEDILNRAKVMQAREDRATALAERRQRQRMSAIAFLESGDPVADGGLPPYGDLWDREYNVRPYPEARPTDHAMATIYDGTSIGYLYGDRDWDDEGVYLDSPYANELRGWTLVRTGAEVRARRKK